MLVVGVKDGVITNISTDDRPTDSLSDPQLRACVRGRSYLRRQYHPERLKYPLKRVGPRGEGNFEPITWDQALDTVAGEMQRVKEAYGNSALFVPYGTGGYSQLTGSQTARRLMNLFGGCLGSVAAALVLVPLLGLPGTALTTLALAGIALLAV